MWIYNLKKKKKKTKKDVLEIQPASLDPNSANFQFQLEEVAESPTRETRKIMRFKLPRYDQTIEYIDYSQPGAAPAIYRDWFLRLCPNKFQRTSGLTKNWISHDKTPFGNYKLDFEMSR